jgi:transposase
MGEGVVAGIDWASEVHVACVMDGDGAVASRFSFTHDGAVIRAMAGRLRAAGVAGVAIERGDGPVVEELLSAGLGVFVVPSRQIKGLRSRYGPAGNKDDRFDAYVLADTLRTDGHRWKPLRPDTEATRALRANRKLGLGSDGSRSRLRRQALHMGPPHLPAGRTSPKLFSRQASL